MTKILSIEFVFSKSSKIFLKGRPVLSHNTVNTSYKRKASQVETAVVGLA